LATAEQSGTATAFRKETTISDIGKLGTLMSDVGNNQDGLGANHRRVELATYRGAILPGSGKPWAEIALNRDKGT
jgi:hypothetical protein